MKGLKAIVAITLAMGGLSCAPKVSFYATTIPAIEGVTTDVTTSREGDEWQVDVKVKNTTDKEVTLKVKLAAEPRFKATQYLFPGINYNGNGFGDDLDMPQDYGESAQEIPFPQGLSFKGEPWVYAYDRGSIPSCTISESEDRVFALFASDKTPASYDSASSMERLNDGSFRHIIYWPSSEAPLCYSDKKRFSERIEKYLTLAPGEEFSATAFAVMGEPKWKNYGFAEVFPVAWRRIDHTVPSQWSVDEVLALDREFQRWGRRQNSEGFWYETILDDMTFRAGYYGTGLSDEGHPVSYYEKYPERNHWYKYDPKRAKQLKKGEYLEGIGREVGFAGQSFQLARLSIEYGLRNDVAEDVDFGLKVLRSWIANRRFSTGLFTSYRDRGHSNRDASNMGWAIGELSRVAMLLERYGIDGSEFREAAKPTVELVLKGVREDGAVGSVWNGDTGEVVNYSGDGAGFMLMGLARYHELTGDERIPAVIEKAFDYYYTKDIDHFRCYGGAMDCSSIDKEGIQPFFTVAKYMYELTGKDIYLDYARRAAWYFVSWLYIHNPIYDADDDMTIFNVRPAGANIVGVEHSALDEYGALLISEFIWLSKIDNEPLWRDVAKLIWLNGTQGFAYEGRTMWHGLERPIGSKSEAIFPSEWSKYRSVGRKRGSINDHLTAWGGIYRTASLLELSPEDLQWLKQVTEPEK